MNYQYQLLPDLSGAEYEILKADIELRGVQVPIEFDENRNVLDGHHRLKICAELGIKDYPSIVRVGMTEDQKKEHVLIVNLARRHLTKEQREKAVFNTKIETGWSNRRIAELFGVSHVTIMRDLDSGGTFVPPEELHETVTGKDGKEYPVKNIINKNKNDMQRTFSALENLESADLPDDTIDSKQAKNLSKEKGKEQKREEIAELGKSAELPITVSVTTGDFRDILANMPDNSIDMIFTDPPYDEKSIPLYGDLAMHAARVLKEGGSLIAYVGHYAIGQVYNLMSDHLRFWWLLGVKHGGNSARLIGKNVFVSWKPMVWFVKGGRFNNEYVADLITSEQPTKTEHEWQQDTSEASYYIEHLTDPGAIILDPFAGSGTTLIAAHKLNRQSIGIEIDEGRANVARHRIEQEC